MDNMDKRLCVTIRNLLPGYAADQLSADKQAFVEQHLTTCADCQAALREWQALAAMLAEAEAAIPYDATAVQGLAAIHTRLRELPTSRNSISERSAIHSIYNSRDQHTTSTLREQYVLTDPRNPVPYQSHPQQRIRPWLAIASVAAIIILAAGLFYVISSHLHPNKSIVSKAPIATTQPTPTATPIPASGSWHTVTTWPAHVADVVFAQSVLKTGYLCANNPTQVPKTSSQWLYKSNDGGMSWQPVGGITTPTVNMPVSMTCNVFVDANDANDVFAQLLLMPTTGATGEAFPVSETLWHSRDGGTNWQQLRIPNLFRGWATLVVVGSRIVGLATYQEQVPPVCDTNPNNQEPHQIDELYASDDGGMTWKQIGLTFVSHGSSITAGSTESAALLLLTIGTKLFVQTFCVASQGGVSSPQQTSWSSTDGGTSWTNVSFPNGASTHMQFTPASAGGFYGIAVNLGSGAKYWTTLFQVLYSSNSGATWKTLPSLTTLPGFQVVPGQTIVKNVIALPDGSVLDRCEQP